MRLLEITDLGRRLEEGQAALNERLDRIIVLLETLCAWQGSGVELEGEVVPLRRLEPVPSDTAP